jgi:hypothetical protein
MFTFMMTCASLVLAAKISGTVTATVKIAEDSQLTGDVICQVTGAPCISFTVSHVSLDLNGYTITGQNDPRTACSGAGTGTESGILSSGQTGVTVRGPGIVENFKGHGIVLNSTTASTITGVTTATNCFSGIFLTGGSSLNELDGNISIRNGNGTAPCGGI